MDLYCQRCGEPWDHYGVYHGDLDPQQKEDFLKGRGCPACQNQELCTLSIPCQECEHGAANARGIFTCTRMRFKRPFRAQLASALADTLGDDTDGIAAEMEDAEGLLGNYFWE